MSLRPSISNFDCGSDCAGCRAGPGAVVLVLMAVHSKRDYDYLGLLYLGGVDFNLNVPIPGAPGTYYVPISQSLSLTEFLWTLGKLYWLVALCGGNVPRHRQRAIHILIYRSGLLDSTFRFSVNLMGGPAMQAKGNGGSGNRKRLLGVSVKVVAPTGQYSGAKLINWGGNRWAFQTRTWIFGKLGIYGCWMVMRGRGSTPRTRHSTMDQRRCLRANRRLFLWKGI